MLKVSLLGVWLQIAKCAIIRLARAAAPFQLIMLDSEV